MVGLAASIVVSRSLGPSGRGVLALVTLVVTTATLFTTFGLGTAYGYLAGKKAFDNGELLGSMVVASLTLGTLTATILVGSSGFLLGGVLRGMTFEQLVITVVSIPFAYLTFFLFNFLIGAGQAALAALLQLCAGVFGAIVTIAAVLLGSQSISVVILVGTISAVIIAAWSLVIVVREHGIRFNGTGRIGVTAARYGAKVYLGTLSGQFWLRADFLVLNTFAGPAAVGEYSIATSLSEKVWLLDSSVSQATLSRVIGSSAEEAAQLVARTARNVVFLAGTSCLALALIAPWLIPFVFGAEFTAAIVPLWLLLPGVLFIAAARPISSYFSGQQGRPQVTSGVSILTAVVGVLAYLALVPTLGAVGAALGSSIAYCVPLVAYVPLFSRSTGLGARDVLIVNREDVRSYGRLLTSAGRAIRLTKLPPAT
jgi:O-antigen/teichoic acid export membrane protein